MEATIQAGFHLESDSSFSGYHCEIDLGEPTNILRDRNSFSIQRSNAQWSIAFHNLRYLFSSWQDVYFEKRKIGN